MGRPFNTCGALAVISVSVALGGCTTVTDYDYEFGAPIAARWS